jgi:putative acetyltransferase
MDTEGRSTVTSDLLRPVRLTEQHAQAAAQVHRRSFDAQLPWLSGLHTPEEDTSYFREHVFRDCAVWGVFAGDVLAGMIAFRPGWVDQLYVLPEYQGKGIGHTLLELAQASSDELQLWTFQRNDAARRFYEKHGFAAVEFTDGAGNEEREPDMRYRWLR